MGPRRNKSSWLFAGGIIVSFLAGCASAPKTTTSHAVTRIDTSDILLGHIRSWLAARSQIAHNLNTTGDIILEQNGESNSASFALKCKRLGANSERIDSLSIEVSGPFGIKVAHFMASPEQYQMYDILHGERMTGATDQRSLEDLTHLNGISLVMMDDLVFGLSPDTLRIGDSINVFASDRGIILNVQDMKSNTTSSLDLNTADSTMETFSLLRYRRWNGFVDPMHEKIQPNVSVLFSNRSMVNGVSIAHHIEATAGQNKLTLDYDKIEVNHPALVVHIKMPQ